MNPLLALARRPLRRAVHDVRHVAPVSYRRATPAVRRVYDELERDFGVLAPPVAVHAPTPEILVPAWELLRSALLVAGAAERAEKEAVAAAVSRANRCPYCVDVHEASHDALAPSDRHRDLESWVIGQGPAPERGTDELVDVAACFEYLNRVVTVLLPDSPLPPAAPPVVRRRALALLGSAARRDVRSRTCPVPAGVLLDRIADAAAAAVPGCSASVTAALDRVLDGGPAGLLGNPVEWALNGIDYAARGPARLAALTAVAPWRVTSEDVTAARGPGGDDVVVALVALGSSAAARRRHAEFATG